MTTITLPPLPDFEGDTSPDIRDFNTKRITRAELRARDLEVARLVLEGAAKKAWTSGMCPWVVVEDIHALEVKHHE